ncbi:hypothetical protein [Actinobaculum suis]|uniref:hypothetical protein n=1 Tax=Actinobaculum suis TaxID=1657 RepID=UPI000AC3CB8C|nr:hypothetical protein [Actinobaculum suis]
MARPISMKTIKASLADPIHGDTYRRLATRDVRVMWHVVANQTIFLDAYLAGHDFLPRMLEITDASDDTRLATLHKTLSEVTRSQEKLLKLIDTLEKENR